MYTAYLYTLRDYDKSDQIHPFPVCNARAELIGCLSQNATLIGPLYW